jgi:hypothetical protein
VQTLIPGQNSKRNEAQLYVFVDASQDVYAAVAYVRNNMNEGVQLRFVPARSRLKTIKAATTIPRLKFLAAEIGLALAKKLNRTLDIFHHNIYLWTDSRAVHDWLSAANVCEEQGFKDKTIPQTGAS